jgi:hypothetical protein
MVYYEVLFFCLSFRRRFDIEVSARDEHKMKKLFLLFLSFFLISCISQYHRGYHYLGEDKKLYYSVVSEKTDKVSRPFEEKAIRYLTEGDVDSFKGLFTDKLSAAVSEDSLRQLKNAIGDRYKPNGQYDRIKLMNANSRTDESEYAKGFDYYDYIVAAYMLHGGSDALVTLQMTKVGESIKLSGFSLNASDRGQREKMFSIQYSVPETIDKAGVSRRKVMIKPN